MLFLRERKVEKGLAWIKYTIGLFGRQISIQVSDDAGQCPLWPWVVLIFVFLSFAFFVLGNNSADFFRIWLKIAGTVAAFGAVASLAYGLDKSLN